MKLVMDFDQQIYASGFATEGEPLAHTLHTVKTAIDKQLKETGCDEYQIYISGEGNFRDDISPAYKATRTARKPAAYNEIREYLITRYKAEEVHGMETDDKVSVLLWEDFKACKGRPGRATLILSSPDKDLKNTPGWHYFPKSGQLQWINDDQARRHFLYQLVMGDRVDNVTGLPQVDAGYAFRMGLGKPPRKGCGEIWAKKIMNLSPLVHEAEINVYRAYIAMGAGAGWSEDQTKEYLTTQGQLLWMVREFDHFGQPIMWNVSEEMWDVARRREQDGEGPISDGHFIRRGQEEAAARRGVREGADGGSQEESSAGYDFSGTGGLADHSSDSDTGGLASQYDTGPDGDALPSGDSPEGDAGRGLRGS